MVIEPEASRPAIVVVSEEPTELASVGSEVAKRYGIDYDVMRLDDAQVALPGGRLTGRSRRRS